MDTYIPFSAYRSMWLIVMFDLPTETKKDRKIYSDFREGLLDDGFHMIQFSIYVRFCPSFDNLQVHIKRTQNKLPPSGEVRLLTFTDKQYSSMEVYHGKSR